MMEKLTFSELERMDWKKAVVVFTEDSWSRVYPLESRSYVISRDSKFFNPNMIGNSLFGNALDGTDNGVRLDWYMYGNNDKDSWNIDYCYIVE
jgi:hypothetical protein